MFILLELTSNAGNVLWIENFQPNLIAIWKINWKVRLLGLVRICVYKRPTETRKTNKPIVVSLWRLNLLKRYSLHPSLCGLLSFFIWMSKTNILLICNLGSRCGDWNQLSWAYSSRPLPLPPMDVQKYLATYQCQYILYWDSLSCPPIKYKTIKTCLWILPYVKRKDNYGI